jgi:hypothetical protein
VRPGGRKARGLRPFYLPVRLFGPSRRSGLTPSQCNLLAALTGELTRTRVADGRADRAQVVGAGRGRRHPGERPVPACPFLGEGAYVLFGGNGTARRPGLHGHGFKLATWARKAAHPDAVEYSIIRLLRDLAALAGPFGLVAAAWNGRSKEWKALEELPALARTPAGRAWLGRCVLRVYTAADYLVRWRNYFATRLGFSTIPGGEDTVDPEEPTLAGGLPVIRTAADLQRWMGRQGLGDDQLAAALGVSRTTISRYRTGRRRWGRPFQAKLDAYLAAQKAAQKSPHVGRLCRLSHPT